MLENREGKIHKKPSRFPVVRRDMSYFYGIFRKKFKKLLKSGIYGKKF
jgi:hypothetical protein